MLQAAPAPTLEKGEAIEGLDASGGGNKVSGMSKQNIPMQDFDSTNTPFRLRQGSRDHRGQDLQVREIFDTPG